MTTPPLRDQPRNVDLLDSALHDLVETGELTKTQADHVHESYVEQMVHAPTAEPPTAVPPSRTRWTTRLAEVAGYLGAALVAAGGAIAVGQQWRHLGYDGQVALLATLAVTFALAAGVIVLVRRQQRSAQSQDAVLRRLASTLFTLCAGAALGLVSRLFVPERGVMPESRVGWMLLSMALVAGLVMVLARIVAPSALAEVALFACVMLAAGGLLMQFGPDNSPTALRITFFAVGVMWAALAYLTRMLTVPTLGAVLGLATAVAMTLGDGTGHTSEVLAALLAVGAFAIYLVFPRWPLIAAAVLSAVVLTFSLVGEAFGAAMALLVAGLVLLALAAGAFYLRRRPHETG